MDKKTMKNNTLQAKFYLEKALSNISSDFSLIDVKQNIRTAISKINEVENKRNKREVLKNKRQNKKEKYAPEAINIIDEMIEEEKSKQNNKDDE
jgi:hypothetical protein